MKHILSLFFAAAFLCPLGFSQFVSELRIAQDGPDVDEYFEIQGSAGTSLSGLHYLVIEYSSTFGGEIAEVVDLNGQVIGLNRNFVCAESTFTFGTPDMVTTLNFNDDVHAAHLLVSGFTGALGDDLDTDDDGILETTPWSQSHGCLTFANGTFGSVLWFCGGTFDGSSGTIGHAFACYDSFTPGLMDPYAGYDSPGDFAPGCLFTFCDPANVNSSGNSVSLQPSFAPGAPSGLHLDAVGGPPGNFGYLLIGTDYTDTPIPIGAGLLCLDPLGSNQLGRYNVLGTPLGSIGQFNAAGIFENVSGTSSTAGIGFDVPNELPFGSGGTIQAGDIFYFQLWYRDQNLGPGSSNFSNVYATQF